MANPYFELWKRLYRGRNIKRIREILGMKQEALAIELGEDWNQKKISQPESKDIIEPQILDQIAKALRVPVDAIKNFNEDAAVNIVSSTFNDNASVNSYSVLNFNPIDKIVELYERIIKEKQEIIDKFANKG